MVKKKVKKNKKKRLTKEEKENKQVAWFFGIFLFLIIVSVGTYLFVQSLDHFKYAGIEFYKEDQGDIELWHGRYPVVYLGELKYIYNFWLRDDPRKNEIPIGSEISVGKNILVSLDPEAGNCQEATMAQIELGKFLKVFPWVNKISSGVTNQTTANELGYPYVTCSSAREDTTVFIIQKSDFPSITKGEKENCYVLNVGDCQNRETIERFIVGVIAQVNSVEI